MNEPRLIAQDIKTAYTGLKHPIFKQLEKRFRGEITQSELEMRCYLWSLDNKQVYLPKSLPQEPKQSPGESNKDFDDRLNQWVHSVVTVKRENKENKEWIEKCKVIVEMDMANHTGVQT